MKAVGHRLFTMYRATEQTALYVCSSFVVFFFYLSSLFFQRGLNSVVPVLILSLLTPLTSSSDIFTDFDEEFLDFDGDSLARPLSTAELISARERLEETKVRFGFQHEEVAVSLATLAALYEENLNYSEAQRLYEEALEIRLHLDDASLDDVNPDDVSFEDFDFYDANLEKIDRIQNSLAWLHRLQLDYDQAIVLYRQILKSREQRYGAEDPKVADTIEDLAGILKIAWAYDEAIIFYESAVSIREKQLGSKHKDVLNLLISLGDVYLFEERLEEAKATYSRALLIIEESQPASTQLVVILDKLIEIFKMQNRTVETEILYKRKLKMAEESSDEDELMISVCLVELADYYRNLKMIRKAEPLYKRALAINEEREQLTGESSWALFNKLAEICKERREYREAASFYKKLINIQLNDGFSLSASGATTTFNNLTEISKHLSQSESDPEYYTNVYGISDMKQIGFLYESQ
jgi:tetratricopeptide (TPR) repeat protein